MSCLTASQQFCNPAWLHALVKVLPGFQTITYTCYLQSLQITVLLVTIQDDVISHAEALSHCQVVEKRWLAERVAHLHDCYICREMNRQGEFN